MVAAERREGAGVVVLGQRQRLWPVPQPRAQRHSCRRLAAGQEERLARTLGVTACSKVAADVCIRLLGGIPVIQEHVNSGGWMVS